MRASISCLGFRSHLATLLLFSFFLPSSSGYKILVYNVKFGHSHSMFMGKLADLLADAGHEVTSLIPEVDPSQADGTSKTRVVRVSQNEETRKLNRMLMKNDDVDMWEMRLSSPVTAYVVGNMMGDMFCHQCKQTIEDDKVIEQLKSEHFDVFITENFDFCGIGLSHAVHAKSVITVSSMILLENVAMHIGMPTVPSYYPGLYQMGFPSGHSLWPRALNAYKTALAVMVWRFNERCTQAVFRNHYGNHFPNIEDLTAASAFVFTNSEPFIDYARPLLRKVVDLGGIGVEQPKALDKHWNSTLNLRKENVLVSFGSIARSSQMKPAIKESLLKSFARFPNTTFIWKYETPEDEFGQKEAAKHPNVVLSKWTPQNDLLNDARMTGFISHSGMASCQVCRCHEETAAGGVPGLFIPIFGDQPRNAAMMQHTGIGVAFEKNDITDDEKLSQAIRVILYDQRIRSECLRVSRMLSRRPFSPRDLFIKHVEFAAEFGSSRALSPPGLGLSLIQLYMLDVIIIVVLFLLTTVFISSIILWKLAKRVLRWLSRREKSKIQ